MRLNRSLHKPTVLYAREELLILIPAQLIEAYIALWPVKYGRCVIYKL